MEPGRCERCGTRGNALVDVTMDDGDGRWLCDTCRDRGGEERNDDEDARDG